MKYSISIIILSLVISASFGQVKNYNDGFSYLFFEKGTVIIFNGLLSPCLKDGQELKTVNKACKKKQEETINLFVKHKITPLDFQDSTYKNEATKFKKIKRELDKKIDTELFFYLDEQNYSIININSIKEENDTLFIQFHRSVYFNCFFTNVQFDLNSKDLKMKITNSGILNIKN